MKSLLESIRVSTGSMREAKISDWDTTIIPGIITSTGEACLIYAVPVNADDDMKVKQVINEVKKLGWLKSVGNVSDPADFYDEDEDLVLCKTTTACDWYLLSPDGVVPVK